MRSVAASFIVAISFFSQASAGTAPPVAPSSQTQLPTGPHRVRGTIVSFAGGLLTMKTDAGEAVAVSVLPTTIFLYNEPRTVLDIHSGDFLGAAAVQGTDGKLHAQDVVLL